MTDNLHCDRSLTLSFNLSQITVTYPVACHPVVCHCHSPCRMSLSPCLMSLSQVAVTYPVACHCRERNWRERGKKRRLFGTDFCNLKGNEHRSAPSTDPHRKQIRTAYRSAPRTDPHRVQISTAYRSANQENQNHAFRDPRTFLEENAGHHSSALTRLHSLGHVLGYGHDAMNGFTHRHGKFLKAFDLIFPVKRVTVIVIMVIKYKS